MTRKLEIPIDPRTGERLLARCYKIHIKNPYQIMQSVHYTGPALPKKDFEEVERNKWVAFDKRHNVKTDIKITEIDCFKARKVRSFIKQRKR